MSDVEFLDPVEPPVETVDETPAPPADAPGVVATGVVRTQRVLLLAAFAGLVLAPWQEMYSVTLGSQYADRDFAVDGWGRIADTVVGGGGQHALRLGILTVVAAGLVLVGFVLSLPVRLPVRLASRAVAGGFVAASVAMAASAAAAAALEGSATIDNYRTALRVEQQDPSYNGLARRAVELHLGGFVWAAAAAALAGALVLALPLLSRTRWRPRLRRREGIRLIDDGGAGSEFADR